MWKRDQAPDVISSVPALMKAMFKGHCACGASVGLGDEIYFDRGEESVVGCPSCKPIDGEWPIMVTPAIGFNEVQRIIDRVKQLRMLPRPLSSVAGRELWQLVLRLKVEMIHKPEVEKFSLEIARRRYRKADLCIIQGHTPTRCVLCQRILPAGRKVLFARRGGKSICVCCPIDFDDIY